MRRRDVLKLAALPLLPIPPLGASAGNPLVDFLCSHGDRTLLVMCEAGDNLLVASFLERHVFVSGETCSLIAWPRDRFLYLRARPRSDLASVEVSKDGIEARIYRRAEGVETRAFDRKDLLG